MSSAADGNDLSGVTLDGRYTLLRKLGEGAMGLVYDAHHKSLRRQVAVKVLHPWLASEEKYRQRFMREARAASRIKHPNVVEILDCGKTPNDSVYLVMEFLHGCDLKEIIRREKVLPWPRARHFLLQAVAALREAHREDIIHRDIKPANCFVCTPPEPGMPERMKLLDFGIAKVGEDPGASDVGMKGITQTGELVGTLAYMAPEFAEGRPASIHSDMYALGITAYELLTGEVPFRGRNEFQVLARHLNEPPVRPRVKQATIPIAVEKVVLTLLAKKPEDRFTSMADLELALLAIPGDVSPDAPLVVPRGGRDREGSGPKLAARSREDSGPKPPVRRREPSGPKPGGPLIERTDIIAPAATEAPPIRRRVPSPAPASAPSPRGESHPDMPAADGDRWGEIRDPHEFDDPKPPRVEWGTVITVVLLIGLSAAAIASVVIRQRELAEPPPAVDPAPVVAPSNEPGTASPDPPAPSTASGSVTPAAASGPAEPASGSGPSDAASSGASGAGSTSG
ncbi:MAG: protein kinase [Myxococcota bacterium]